jgi:hypothetical protein
MDINHYTISDDMWNDTQFLMVREMWPCKFGSPEEWTRIP